MEFIRVWTMQVAGAVIFGVLCEMLAPEGKMKSIVRIVLGLIVVVAVINPFAGIADRDLFLGELTFFDNLTVGNEQEILETRNTLVRAYKRRLRDEINVRLAGVTQDFEIDVRPEVHTNNRGWIDDPEFGAITDILVILTPQYTDEPNIEEIQVDITSILTEDFGVDEQNIRFWRDDFGSV